MKYWFAGILLTLMGYFVLVTTHLYSDNPDDYYSLADTPFIGEILEDRYYGDHKEKAKEGNTQAMLQMYLYYNGAGKTKRALVYENMLRDSAAMGSALAQMNLDIFVDHDRRDRTNREELVFTLSTLKEREQYSDYRDIWSNRRNADAFGTYLSFVSDGDEDAVDVWENETDLWKGWDWPHSEWLRGVNLAKAYPVLAARRMN